MGKETGRTRNRGYNDNNNNNIRWVFGACGRQDDDSRRIKFK